MSHLKSGSVDRLGRTSEQMPILSQFRGQYTADNRVPKYENVSALLTDSASSRVMGFSLPKFEAIGENSAADNSGEQGGPHSAITVLLKAMSAT